MESVHYEHSYIWEIIEMHLTTLRYSEVGVYKDDVLGRPYYAIQGIVKFIKDEPHIVDPKPGIEKFRVSDLVGSPTSGVGLLIDFGAPLRNEIGKINVNGRISEIDLNNLERVLVTPELIHPNIIERIEKGEISEGHRVLVRCEELQPAKWQHQFSVLVPYILGYARTTTKPDSVNKFPIEKLVY